MPTNPGRFLFVTWPGGGNLPPLLALGVMLTARGHDVTVLGPPELDGPVSAEVLRFHPHRTPADWTGGTGFTWPPGPTPDQQLDCLRGLAADVADALQQEPVDVVVVDYMQPEALSAVERAGLPIAAFVHTLYWRVARAAFSPMDVVSGGRDAVNKLRAELGLADVDPLSALLDRAEVALIATAESLDRPDGPLPQNARYVGPIVEEVGPDAGWRPPWPSGAPVVHACTSTVSSTDQAAVMLQRVVDACSSLPVSLYVTATDPVRSALRPAANTYVSGYVRHAAVLPLVDLLVCHAGLSSIGAALSFGVPMVCIPQFHEQPDNAAHVTALGVGRALATDASTDEIRDAVQAALADTELKQVAANIAQSLRVEGAHPAVTRLEEML
jgi:UDP:flavonoid glycosyltransferase YjiC (YdhE family)